MAFIAIKNQGKKRVRNIVLKKDNVFVHKTKKTVFNAYHLHTGAWLIEFESLEIAKKYISKLNDMFPPYHSKLIRQMAKKTSLKRLFNLLADEIESTNYEHRNSVKPCTFCNGIAKKGESLCYQCWLGVECRYNTKIKESKMDLQKAEQQRRDIQGQINVLEQQIKDNDKTWSDYLESGILPDLFQSESHLIGFLDQDTESLQNELNHLHMALAYCGSFELDY